MVDMITRVADANRRVWDEWPEPIDARNVGAVRLAAARASIAALSEPTVAMNKGGTRAIFRNSYGTSEQAENCWRAMVAVATEEVAGEQD